MREAFAAAEEGAGEERGIDCLCGSDPRKAAGKDPSTKDCFRGSRTAFKVTWPGDHRLSAPQYPHGTSSWAAGSMSQRKLTAYHPHGTLIAQNDGPHSLAPRDDPTSGLGPITVAVNVHIPGPYMQHTSGI